MIVADQLTRRFGTRTVVDRVTFRVPRGEVVGFLGPNGAGKSTTLKMVAGFLPLTSGRVSVAGFDVEDEPFEAKRRLGYMPEAVPLYPEMRVEEYLAFRAEIKGVEGRGRRAAVARSMEQADVTDVARRLIGELSKGYRQRVGLADALVASPELLILDEPTAGLDPNQIVQVRELIKSLGKDHTIFLSTHILSEVEAVCSRVVIIAAGKIAAEGTPDEIRRGLRSQQRLATLTVRGTEAGVRSAAEAIEGVKVDGEPARVDAVELPADGAAVWRFGLALDDEGAGAAGRAEQLIAALVAAGLGVRGFELKGESLESIFAELTASERAGDTDASTTARRPARKGRAKDASP